jgi:hypothetical protein
VLLASYERVSGCGTRRYGCEEHATSVRIRPEGPGATINPVSTANVSTAGHSQRSSRYLLIHRLDHSPTSRPGSSCRARRKCYPCTLPANVKPPLHRNLPKQPACLRSRGRRFLERTGSWCPGGRAMPAREKMKPNLDLLLVVHAVSSFLPV